MRLTVPWTLVGGQMVLLHALEHGQAPLEPSQDGDVVADLRADHGALIQAVRQLYALGFALDSISLMASPTATHARQSLGPS